MGSLGDRMKNYEANSETTLHCNMPIILRIDGRAFHILTRGLEKPFDNKFIQMMNTIALDLCKNEIQNVKLAYLQSDEISFLIKTDNSDQSDWFNNRIQKMCSISASRASSVATRYDIKNKIFNTKKPIMFDARAFIIPRADVINYVIWRQLDWTRNSIQMLARSLYSHRELHRKSQSEMQEMIFQKGQNWNDLPDYLKRGRCIIQQQITDYISNSMPVQRNVWTVDNNIPIFTKNRYYINRYLNVGDNVK